MGALEEDDLDACSSSRSGFFHLGLPGFPKSLDSDSQEERSRLETSGFTLSPGPGPESQRSSQKTEFSEGPAPEAFSWGPELNALRLDPGYHRQWDRLQPVCQRLPCQPPGATATEHGYPAGWGHGSPGRPSGEVTGAPSSSVLQALTPGLLALEDGSSDEEYYDAADKFTPPDALSR